MDTMRISGVSTGAEISIQCNSLSSFVSRRCNNERWKTRMFPAKSRTWRPAPTRRLFLSVKSVSSEPKTKLTDTVTDSEQEAFISSLNLFAPDAASVASSIKYHAEFTPLFSPEKFELPKAFFATAQSVRDALIMNWNATYEYYNRVNVKQAYYLSMEFLQGRALSNAVGNLGLNGAYADALKRLGFDLESVASQEPDPALGNGGLGRLASCFLDSMATLNYPAWGYGLRYKYGLFKQRITKDGQEEAAEDWLELSNPWEIVRNDVTYPVKFYGKVVFGTDGKRKWIGGEDIVAVAYDVPIPGYKTKTTINLRLWSTKAPSEDFDLSSYNSGKHTEAAEALFNAEKICYVLYPGDESNEGKALRLKQQYTLCSASLQDIVARFETRSGGNVNWEEFPEKVAVQMNDTHPTLCIPELMRILMDLKGLSWEDAWKITQRTVAYTNHTVLPEALEKWSLELMEKLLPRHVEIIEKIDEELVSTIVSEYGTVDPDLLEEKLKAMRILENVELPSAFADVIVKPKKKPVTAKDTIEQSEDSKEEAQTVVKKEQEEEQTAGEEEEVIAEPIVKPPKMVRMANLAVVGGVKMESFTLATPRLCFKKVSSELDTSFNSEDMVFGLELEAEHRLTETELLVENGVEENRNRIHFLEERNEEMLSKRLLKLSRLDKVRSALELFDSMRFLSLQPNAHACNSFLSCLLRNGYLQKAFIVFEFMRIKEIVTGHTYSLMLKAVAEVKGCDSALRMFTGLERDPKHKSLFDVVLYNTAISLCGRINNVCEAERIWRVMNGDGQIGTEITYSLLISIFVRCGRSELALDAYEEMINNDISPREDAMYAMISACTKEEKWDLALQIFQSMLKKGMKPNLVACNTLINSLGKAGKVGLVFKVYSVAKSLGHKPDEYTWNALLTAIYKANRYADVLQLFDMIRSEKLCCLNEYLYNTAMVSCQKLGSWEKAVKLLYEMECSGLTVSTSSYNLVISACEKSRTPRVALQVYVHMVQRDCKPDTFTYLSLVRSCIWGSLWDEVKDILKKVEPDVSLYNAAIHGMCLRREYKFAKELYVKMREMGLEPDGKTRAMMLQNLKKHQK